MRRTLSFSLLLLGVLAVSSQADARMGFGGGFGSGFAPGFRGFSGGSFIHVAPSSHFVTGFHRQFFPHRQFFAAQRFHGLRLRRGQAFAPIVVLYGGDWWWPDVGQGVTYAPPPEAPVEPVQPEVIVIQSDNQQPKVAEATPDYGYVGGCHAIPNGYHCDTNSAVR
jgi:hypothetical protein